jgi:catechol 2,3-dioxygenase-like lactoylglutathione lyase family enzyme
MRADRVLETCLYVDDLGAAEAFYREVLGLEFISKVDGRHVFFRCGQGVFLLFNPDQTAISTGRAPTHGAHGPGHAAFRLAESDIEAWRSQLQTRGVEIETEFEWPGGGYSIYFRDPAGNSLELTTLKTWGL